MDINFSEIISVLIRCVLSLTILFVITKILGKKQVSQLSVFDYTIGISIGNFAAEMSINLESNIFYGIMAVTIFGVFSFIVSKLAMKSIYVRRFFMGTPTILIENGKIALNGLRKVKFDINDLLEEARGAGYFNIFEIEYAVLEVNGKISFLPKGEYKTLTNKDLNLKTSKQALCANILIDGKILKENLRLMNKDELWLKNQIKNKGYNSLKDILLITLDNNEKITIYEKNNIFHHNVL